MFCNLKAEMARRGLSGNKIAEGVGITGKTFSNKMIGISEFTRSEMFRIRDTFFEGEKIDYLFAFEERAKNLKKNNKTA